MNFKEIRAQLVTFNYGTEITKADFERHFTKTDERITFTFNGWDGKSYDGETRTARILHANLAGLMWREFRILAKSSRASVRLPAPIYTVFFLNICVVYAHK